MSYYSYFFGDDKKTKLLNKINNENNNIKNTTNNINDKIIKEHQKINDMSSNLDKLLIEYEQEVNKEKLSHVHALSKHVSKAFKGVYDFNSVEITLNTAASTVDLLGIAADTASTATKIVSDAISDVLSEHVQKVNNAKLSDQKLSNKGAYTLDGFRVVLNTAVGAALNTAVGAALNTAVGAAYLLKAAADTLSTTSSIVSYTMSQEKNTAFYAPSTVGVYSTLFAGATFVVGAYAPGLAPAFGIINGLNAVKIIASASAVTFGCVATVNAVNYAIKEANEIAKATVETANYVATKANEVAKATVETANYVATKANEVAQATVETANYVATKANEVAKATVETANYVATKANEVAQATVETANYIDDKTGLYTKINYVADKMDVNLVQPTQAAFAYYVTEPVASALNTTHDAVIATANAANTAINSAVTAMDVNIVQPAQASFTHYIVEPAMSAPSALYASAITSANAANTAMNAAVTAMDVNIVQPAQASFTHYVVEPLMHYETVGFGVALGMNYLGEHALNITSAIFSPASINDLLV
jgi:hypothetical protein